MTRDGGSAQRFIVTGFRGAKEHIVAQSDKTCRVITDKARPRASRGIDHRTITVAGTAAGPCHEDTAVLLPVLHRPRPRSLGSDLLSPHRLDRASDCGKL